MVSVGADTGKRTFSSGDRDDFRAVRLAVQKAGAQTLNQPSLTRAKSAPVQARTVRFPAVPRLIPRTAQASRRIPLNHAKNRSSKPKNDGRPESATFRPEGFQGLDLFSRFSA
jgi:hypothetical protein